MKSLLALRDQEVKEWRSRRTNLDQSPKFDPQVAHELQQVRAHLQEREQELSTLKIKVRERLM